eukprot:TRINITY_DN696_c1_g1_i1.p1 TRINITY_DN696_c1_g1~~TRINITY_DN696_c1_g1_i1.p1  ORF type:complete len:498 (+),score=118.29 TRINITY_DN696_c1_g1_i1:1-1494(+)
MRKGGALSATAASATAAATAIASATAASQWETPAEAVRLGKWLKLALDAAGVPPRQELITQILGTAEARRLWAFIATCFPDPAQVTPSVVTACIRARRAERIAQMKQTLAELNKKLLQDMDNQKDAELTWRRSKEQEHSTRSLEDLARFLRDLRRRFTDQNRQLFGEQFRPSKQVPAAEAAAATAAAAPSPLAVQTALAKMGDSLAASATMAGQMSSDGQHNQQLQGILDSVFANCELRHVAQHLAAAATEQRCAAAATPQLLPQPPRTHFDACLCTYFDHDLHLHRIRLSLAGGNGLALLERAINDFSVTSRATAVPTAVHGSLQQLRCDKRRLWEEARRNATAAASLSTGVALRAARLRTDARKTAEYAQAALRQVRGAADVLSAATSGAATEHAQGDATSRAAAVSAEAADRQAALRERCGREAATARLLPELIESLDKQLCEHRSQLLADAMPRLADVVTLLERSLVQAKLVERLAVDNSNQPAFQIHTVKTN